MQQLSSIQELELRLSWLVAQLEERDLSKEDRNKFKEERDSIYVRLRNIHKAQGEIYEN